MCLEAKQLMGWSQGIVAKSQDRNDNFFMAAVLSKGGAEGWVQVELNAILKSAPGVVNVRREEAIYTDASKAVDLQIDCKERRTFVEIKVESLHQSAGDGRQTKDHKMWEKVGADVVKLRDERTANAKNEPAFVLAIVWSGEATESLQKGLKMSGLNYDEDTYDLLHEKDNYSVRFFVIRVK
jgi:hypothetical protein